MLWSGECDSIEEYYNKCVGVPLQLLPTVLGLKLAVDLELGSKYVRLLLINKPCFRLLSRKFVTTQVARKIAKCNNPLN